MSFLLQKGQDYNAEYSSTDYPVLTTDWTGSVSFYSTYPGTSLLTKDLTLSGNVLTLAVTVDDILNLPSGNIIAVATITNPVLAITISSSESVTVSEELVSQSTLCKIYGTVIKSDGTPAGKPSKSIYSTESGVKLNNSWTGIEINITHSPASLDASSVVNEEKLKVYTNASGYFEAYVIQGLTVTISSSYFGTHTIDTTALTEFDISTLF